MDRIKLKGFVFASLSAALYGLVPYFSKTLQLDGYGDDVILTYRYLIAALIYLFYVLVRRVNVRIPLATAIEIIVVGGVCLVPTGFLFLLSFDYIPTGISTAVSFLYPVVVAVLMVVFYHQKLSLGMKAGIVLAVAGVALLSWMPGKIRFQGIVYSLLSAVTYGAYFVVLNRPRLRVLSAEVMTFYLLVFGTACFVLVSVLNGRMELIVKPTFLFNTGMLAVFSTIAASVLLIKGVGMIGSVRTSVLGTFEPFIAMLIGIVHFKEHTEFSTYAGFFFVVVAVVMVIYKRK